MVNAHQNLNSSRDLTMSLSGMICHPWARICYDEPPCQAWSLYLHPLRRYEKYKLWKMGWLGVVGFIQGPAYLAELVPHQNYCIDSKQILLNDEYHHSIEHIQFLLAFQSYVHSWHRFWDIARYLSQIADINLPHLYLARQFGVTPMASVN